MKRPLLVLGLDGLDPQLVERLSRGGALPHLARLIDESTSLVLQPGEERFTGLAWEQFSSGRDGASGGRASAVHFEPATYLATQPVTRATPFTAGLGASVVAFDVPYFDLRSGNARGFARWGAHDPGVPRHAVPDDLAAEIDSRFGAYPAEPWIYGFVWPDVEATRRMGADLLRAVEVRAELTTWLFRERLPDWDLALTVVAELHSASEALWHGLDDEHPLHAEPSADAAREAMEAIYGAIDRLVGRVVDACDHADVVAFTPHGMGANHADVASMLLLPELIYRWETGRRAFEVPPAWRARGLGPASWPADSNWSDVVLDELQRPRTAWWQRRLPKPKDHRFALGWMPAAHYRAAWPRMRAFAVPSFYDGRVRFNVKGREATGRVRPDELPDLVEEVRALLESTRDLDTGHPLDCEVLSTHDGTFEAHPEADADLIVRWGRAVHGFEHPELGRIGPAPVRRPGGHTGGPGRIAVVSDDDLDLPAGLGSPATIAGWIRDASA
ncbi:MAG: alkaline phosphatase family protein [Planctomycetota bacterium]|nr:alkaline phosphatase family protein [Planctomycetota bacterium]